jgi:hypothetical protein
MSKSLEIISMQPYFARLIGALGGGGIKGGDESGYFILAGLDKE